MGPMSQVFEALKGWKLVYRVPFTSSVTGERVALAFYERPLEAIEKRWGGSSRLETVLVQDVLTGESRDVLTSGPPIGEYVLRSLPGMPAGLTAKLLKARSPLSFQLHPRCDEVWFPSEGATYHYEGDQGHIRAVFYAPQPFVVNTAASGKTRGNYTRDEDGPIDEGMLHERVATKGEYIKRGQWHQLIKGEVLEVRTEGEAETYRKGRYEKDPEGLPERVSKGGLILVPKDEDYRYDIYKEDGSFVGSFRYSCGNASSIGSPEPNGYELQLLREKCPLYLRRNVPDDLELVFAKRSQELAVESGEGKARLSIVTRMPQPGESGNKVWRHEEVPGSPGLGFNPQPRYRIEDLPVVNLGLSTIEARASLSISFS